MLRKIGSEKMDAAVALISRVEKRQRSRTRAYQWVGERVGRSSRWVQNLVAGRLSGVTTEIGAAIDALLIEEWKQEIARLEHELALARQTGAHPLSQQVSEVETMLARLRSLMAGAS